MEKKQPAVIQRILDAINEQLVIITPHMLHHADADNAVEFSVQFRKITVIQKFHGEEILESFLLDSFLKLFVLFMA